MDASPWLFTWHQESAQPQFALPIASLSPSSSSFDGAAAQLMARLPVAIASKLKDAIETYDLSIMLKLHLLCMFLSFVYQLRSPVFCWRTIRLRVQRERSSCQDSTS
jgi:hypothetical protein